MAVLVITPGEEGDTRATLLRWHKHVGDAVADGDELFTYSMQSGTYLAVSEQPGRLMEIYLSEGESRSLPVDVALLALAAPSSQAQRDASPLQEAEDASWQEELHMATAEAPEPAAYEEPICEEAACAQPEGCGRMEEYEENAGYFDPETYEASDVCVEPEALEEPDDGYAEPEAGDSQTPADGGTEETTCQEGAPESCPQAQMGIGLDEAAPKEIACTQDAEQAVDSAAARQETPAPEDAADLSPRVGCSACAQYIEKFDTAQLRSLLCAFRALRPVYGGAEVTARALLVYACVHTDAAFLGLDDWAGLSVPEIAEYLEAEMPGSEGVRTSPLYCAALFRPGKPTLCMGRPEKEALLCLTGCAEEEAGRFLPALRGCLQELCARLDEKGSVGASMQE